VACIRKRRGRWVADYRDATGKRHWESFDTRKAAEDALAAHKVAIRRGEYVAPNDSRTVRDAYESWRTLCAEGSDNRTGAPLRHTTRTLYAMTWRVHVAPRWGDRKLRTVDAEGVATWRQEMLTAGAGVQTVRNALDLLRVVLRHARRFRWMTGDPFEHVRRPACKSKVRAFTPDEIARLLDAADPRTATFLRLVVVTGLRFGEAAGLKWERVDLSAGTLRVVEQYTHGAWSELKTANARRTLPLPAAVAQELRLHRLRTPGPLVFPAPGGGPTEYHNWRTRTWLPLLRRTGPTPDDPDRVAVKGSPHMLRHSFATALIRSGATAKVVQTLMGHHSAAFTMDQYADVWPEDVADAGDRVAAILLPSGSKTVAAGNLAAVPSVEVVDSVGAG